ncbi:P-loop containing nucleoside triphosphate hydrolase protein [Dioszegia hungarica]|uniref:P-loop containing nucleoside triphosphate hydrolase protein n=1 Tax=Dioszegia hungarica TaxID=4972 RepID=A0AA38H3G9_9TREE|nr:P-loop containing nucleoside triphosphate hydrolase protein [Dioszegia hungarica]KAI9633857.1 P-loop containing nucleoside triphosphate hydrolase protein [Dioszegia hungarica]
MSGFEPSGPARRPDMNRKLVVVGDGGCGKTCLLTVYAENRFPEEYVPTVFENLVTRIPSPTDPTKIIELALWDTAGQEDFDRLRPLSYNDTDVILVVFACNHRPSLMNVQDKWYPEMAHFCESVPLLLICTKIDLRDDPTTTSLMAAQGTSPITALEGEKVAKEIGARRYLECSAKMGRGVREVFDGAVRESLRKKGRGVRGKKCVVL